MLYTKNIAANPISHTAAWRLAKKSPYAGTALVNVVVNSTRWGPNTRGADFWGKVLGPCTGFGAQYTTVQELLDTAATVGLKPHRVQSMLAWLYTWGGQVEINGVAYAATVNVPTPKQRKIPASPKAA